MILRLLPSPGPQISIWEELSVIQGLVNLRLYGHEAPETGSFPMARRPQTAGLEPPGMGMECQGKTCHQSLSMPQSHRASPHRTGSTSSLPSVPPRSMMTSCKCVRYLVLSFLFLLLHNLGRLLPVCPQLSSSLKDQSEHTASRSN